MVLLDRAWKITARRIGESFEITVAQIDYLPGLNTLEFCVELRGVFDKDLRLEGLDVLRHEGVRGTQCMPAAASLKRLIGAQVGNGFGAAIERLRTPDSCTRYTSMLQQMAVAVFRCKQIEVFEQSGQEAFIEHDFDVYGDSCIGFQRPQRQAKRAEPFGVAPALSAVDPL